MGGKKNTEHEKLCARVQHDRQVQQKS